MKKQQTGQLATAILLFGLAGFFTLRWWQNHREQEPEIYFYDVSAKKLFTAPQNAVPPIKGLDGAEEDGLRALVFSPSGDCEKDQKIAYLEKYSPELKKQFEASQANPHADLPRMPRSLAQAHTFVRRLEQAEWHAMDTEEAGIIVGEWRLNAPAGTDPVVCIP